MTGRRRRLAVALVIGLLTAGAAPGAETVPEPDDYRRDAYRAPTPATLRGARVLTSAEAEILWRDKSAVFVDVMPQPPRPAGLAPGTFWRSPPRETLPGAIWLPNTGFGDLAPETLDYLRKGLEVASGGRKDQPLVFFCHRACWMSWNAARRAIEEGYTAVAWYPDGTDGWAEGGHPLEPVRPATP